MSGIFITGTDTGVGKTILSAALIATLRARGVDAVPMKPVQTGCEKRGNTLVAPDLEWILFLTGLTPKEDELSDMAPFMYEPACSPHLAAQEADRPIDLKTIHTAYQKLSAAHDLVVVEGAGGILVPLDDQNKMIDLAEILGTPVVVAARPGLGTLNHTLLTLEALYNQQLEPAAVVVVNADNDYHGFIEQDNLKTLERLSELPVLGPLPFFDFDASETSLQESFLAIMSPELEPWLASLEIGG